MAAGAGERFVVALTGGAKVDLDELAEVRSQQDWPAEYLDPATGECHHAMLFDQGLDDLPDEPDPAWIEPEADSRGSYAVMVEFTSTVDDPRLRERLERALEGRGAFRRFRDTSYRDADEPTGRRWSDVRLRADYRRVLAWLVEQGLVTNDAAAQVDARLAGPS